MLSEFFRNIPFRTPNGAQNDPLGDPNGAHHITSHHISGANSYRCPIPRQLEVRGRLNIAQILRGSPDLGDPATDGARGARATPPYPLDTFQVAYAPTSAR